MSERLDVAYYYPAPFWGWSESGWVKSLLLFFDQLAILLPGYMYGQHVAADPATVAPLEERGLLRVLEPDEWVDEETVECLAEVIVELLTNGAFDELPGDVGFQELSQSRVGYAADVGLADMVVEELEARGLARPSEPLWGRVESLGSGPASDRRLGGQVGADHRSGPPQTQCGRDSVLIPATVALNLAGHRGGGVSRDAVVRMLDRAQDCKIETAPRHLGEERCGTRSLELGHLYVWSTSCLRGSRSGTVLNRSTLQSLSGTMRRILSAGPSRRSHGMRPWGQPRCGTSSVRPS